MPIAKAFSSEMSTASTATMPEMKIEFQTFSGKFTRSQKFWMPVKSIACGSAKRTGRRVVDRRLERVHEDQVEGHHDDERADDDGDEQHPVARALLRHAAACAGSAGLARGDDCGGSHQSPALSLRSIEFCTRMKMIETTTTRIVRTVAMVAP